MHSAFQCNIAQLHSAQWSPMHNCTVLFSARCTLHSALQCSFAQMHTVYTLQRVQCFLKQVIAANRTPVYIYVLCSVQCSVQNVVWRNTVHYVMLSIACCTVFSVQCLMCLSFQCSVVQLCVVWQVCCSHYKLITENQPLIKRWWW